MTTDLYQRPLPIEQRAIWNINAMKLPLLLLSDARFSGHKVATLVPIAKGTLVAELSGEMRHQPTEEYERRGDGMETFALG